jgi:lysophospholipase L1-like esterase
VLHIGDSFVHVGFSQSLKPLFEAAGARYVVRARASLYTGTILNALQVTELMRNHKPVLVIVNIGANEMRMPHPDDHAGAVRKVSEAVSRYGATCVWVTPPSPVDQGQTGIVEVIQRETSPCRVFDSSPLAPGLPRAADKIHPSHKGGKLWADAFWAWLQREQDPSRNAFRLVPRVAQ